MHKFRSTARRDDSIGWSTRTKGVSERRKPTGCPTALIEKDLKVLTNYNQKPGLTIVAAPRERTLSISVSTLLHELAAGRGLV